MNKVLEAPVVPPILTPKEYALLIEVRRGSPNQRDLSEKLEFSLGMINILMKRLADKGCLTSAGGRYALTAAGQAELERRSHALALYAWQNARRIGEAVQNAVIAEYWKGLRRAPVVARAPAAALIRRALAEKDLPGLELDFVESFSALAAWPPVVLAATAEPVPALPAGTRLVPLLDGLAIEFRYEEEQGG